jgi:plasmid maintenance system antidote protein VapI
MDTQLRRNIHPGEVLREEFLEPLGLSQNRLAR